MITAPFNFVPLSEKVFFPDWAEKVSHDVPFEDAQSGVIDITITAKSPIFVRDHENQEEFCQHNGTYYIPSSSVKGMVRNVLEIMSFSKIPIDDKTHTKIMSVRDMTNRKELVGTADGCGFLKQNSDDTWYIEDYGKPRTIEYDSRNKSIGTVNCDFDTAEEKYSQENTPYIQISVKNDMKDLYDRNNKFLGKKRVASIVNSNNNAYLILTGGIDNKKNEFVFTKNDRVSNIKNIEEVVDKFKKVYFESDSIDGNFWKNNYNPDIGIPIFYKKTGNKVTDIGLSQLFKLAYNYTIDEATKQILEIIDRNKKKYLKLDLAETIFGTIQDELVKDRRVKKESFALKGRVQFSHFKCNSTPEPFDEVYTVLGSPNPSFYPEYIKQNCQDNGKVINDEYNTLMDKGSKIAGWKRYPLRYSKPKFNQAEEGTDSATRFIPLGDYNRDNFNEFSFSGKVRFHNLKKVEIGALISALTFHNNQNDFYHNIGMAKSLGFGKIKIDIDTSKYQEHLIAYEMLMNKALNRDWIETEQIKELFVMAYKDLKIDSKLEYLVLDPDEKINKFVDTKKEKKCLPKCSELFDIGGNHPKSLLTDELLTLYKEKENRIKAEQEAKEKWESVQNVDRKYYEKALNDFIAKYPQSEHIGEAQSALSDLKDTVNPENTNMGSLDSIDTEKDLLMYLAKNKSNLDDEIETIKRVVLKFYKKYESNKKKDKFKKDIDKKSYKGFFDKLDISNA